MQPHCCITNLPSSAEESLGQGTTEAETSKPSLSPKPTHFADARINMRKSDAAGGLTLDPCKIKTAPRGTVVPGYICQIGLELFEAWDIPAHLPVLFEESADNREVTI